MVMIIRSSLMASFLPTVDVVSTSLHKETQQLCSKLTKTPSKPSTKHQSWQRIPVKHFTPIFIPHQPPPRLKHAQVPIPTPIRIPPRCLFHSQPRCLHIHPSVCSFHSCFCICHRFWNDGYPQPINPRVQHQMHPLSDRTPQNRSVTRGPASDGSGGDTEAEHFVNGCVKIGKGCGENLGGGWQRMFISSGVDGAEKCLAEIAA